MDVKKKHSMQPLVRDGQEVLRFQKNEIVRRLLDDGPFTLNDIAEWNASKNDRVQFAQLIGYSLAGFNELSYADDETCSVAEQMYHEGISEMEARLKYYQSLVSYLKSRLREPVATLFDISPDDLAT